MEIPFTVALLSVWWGSQIANDLAHTYDELVWAAAELDVGRRYGLDFWIYEFPVVIWLSLI